MTERMLNMYDVLIIGGGPAGLTAGLYARRAGLKAILFEGMFIGGQAASTSKIENYPGFIDGISGTDLCQKFSEQSKKFGLETVNTEVKSINPFNKIKLAVTEKGVYRGKTLLLCMGASPRLLNIPGEEEFKGMGVSYCATCDGAFYKDKTVAVIGGGDTAVQDAIFLCNFAKKIYLIHRRDELRAANILQQRVNNNPKVSILWNTVAEKINGKDAVTDIDTKNVESNESGNIKVDGVFVAVGEKPNTVLVQDKIKLSEGGFIVTDEEMKTDIPGVFAAGDLRHKTLRQVLTAASDGAVASFSAQNYIINEF